MKNKINIVESKLNWIHCPECGYRMNISYKNNAKCEKVFVRCKDCKKIFEIKL